MYPRSSSPVEVPALCRQLQQNYKNNEKEEIINDTSNRKRKLRPRSHRGRSQQSNRLHNWKLECKKFLQMMWLSKDSKPFR